MNREQAVAVARDVLKRLEGQKLTLKAGRYIRQVRDFGDWLRMCESEDIRPHLDEVESVCEVCALGALLMSKARLYNAVRGRDLVDYLGDRQKTNLAAVFGRESLLLIEVAFEQNASAVRSASALGAAALNEAVAFTSPCLSPRDRLRAILENVIANDGEFVPGPVAAAAAADADPLPYTVLADKETSCGS